MSKIDVYKTALIANNINKCTVLLWLVVLAIFKIYLMITLPLFIEKL
jgi:hypothetical protein